MNFNRAFEADNGFLVSDTNTFFTGGTSSPVGLDLPQGTLYTQETVSGINIWKKYGLLANEWRIISAQDIPYDDSGNSIIVGQDVQAALSDIDTRINNFDQNSQHRGWEQVSDTQYTVGSRLIIPNNTRTLIPNNAGSILNPQIPQDITTFWDPINNRFLPDRNGDFYHLRLSFSTTADKNNAQGVVELDIGGSQGVIWSSDIFYTKGANVVIDTAFAIPVYTLATFIANGGQFYITTSENATVYDIQLLIFRTYRGR